MVKFEIPSSDEDSEEKEERLDESKHSDKEDLEEEETKVGQESQDELDDSFQETNNAKLQLMNYTLFPQEESTRLDFDEDTEPDFDTQMTTFGLPTSSQNITPVASEQVYEPMYVLEPEPAGLPRRYEYQPRGFDLGMSASSIQDRKRTCSFPFRVGWGPRGQFVHTLGRTVIAVNKIQIRPPNSQPPDKAREQIISRLSAHLHTPPPPRDRPPHIGEVCQGCWKSVVSPPPLRCSHCEVIAHAGCLSLVQSQTERKEQNFGLVSDSRFVCSHHCCTACGEPETYMCEVCPNAFCEEHVPTFAIRKENNSRGILCCNECDEKSKTSNFNLVNSHLASLCNKYDNDTELPHPPLGGRELSPDRSVWELVKRLWCREFGGRTGTYEDVYARRTSLSRWLEDTMRTEIEQDAKKSKNDADVIVTFLTGHNISRACKRAFETKNLRLATLLSQAGEGCTLREDVKNQTDGWKKSGAWGLLSEPYQNIYLLLGGGAFEEGLRPWAQQFSKRLSWLQGFGLQLWFGESPQNVSIEHALVQYQEAVKRKEAPAPVPSRKPCLRTVWKKNETKDDIEEVRVGLLKYYCHTLKYSSKHLLPRQESVGQGCLPELLRPEAWVKDPLDYSLSWHLHDLLQFTSAYSLDEFPKLESLYMNFIWQLEAMGEWEWAIYVALHTPAGNNTWTANEEVAKEILMRNASVVPDAALKDVPITQDFFATYLDRASEHEPRELMGVSNPQAQLHLSACKASWWHEAQAVRARYERLPSQEFSHLLACVDSINLSDEARDVHLAQSCLERAAKVAVTELRPRYLLTGRDMSELDFRLPYQTMKDMTPQDCLNEPEAEVSASEPKLTSSRTFYKLTLDRSVPLSHEVLGELSRFQENFEF